MLNLNTESLKYQFKTATIVTKIIVINAIVFLVLNLVAFLFRLTPSNLMSWFSLPDSFSKVILQPWSLLTYSFLHFGFWHLFWNMVVLYWFGSYVLNLFSQRRFLSVYLIGALAGGLLYLISYSIFPVFSNYSGHLIGASAAVRAIMIFIAAYTPEAKMRVFTFSIKLWHIGVAIVVLDILQLTSNVNPGGMLAHLGGALFGYVYAINLKKGNDIGNWFENIIFWVENRTKPKKKRAFKKVYRTTQSRNKRSFDSDKQKKVDAILDKIAKSGYDSLTKKEKEFLFKAGKD